MIHVRDLTKRYVGRTAVDNISFDVERGEVVGFLGPNGAGKTTTIRMLTGYFPPSSGTATVAGFDVFHQSLQARRCIGYMPENVPLYTDMRVKEYLNFRAALKGLSGRDLRKNVGEVLEMCGLKEMRKKMIGNLSKGYRQRVGLADALVHKPELLILDEPTNGLDPNQIRRVRNLIKQLGLTHTIMISTHILSEVELVCDRVIIVDRGKVCACETPENLIAKLRTAGTVRVELKVKPSLAMQKLENIKGVRRVANDEQTSDGWSVFTLRVEAGTDVRMSLDELVRENNWPMRELHQETATLEDVFVEMTQNEHTAA